MHFSLIVVRKITLISSILIALIVIGCQEPAAHRKKADEVAYNIIRHKQIEAMGKPEDFTIVRSSDLLRRRLLTEQGLQYPDKNSLGSDKLDHIEHWPDPEYLKAYPDNKFPKPLVNANVIKISLIEALQIGARNSFTYQSEKEDIFRTALQLDLEMNDFRSIFAQQFDSLISSDSTGSRTVSGTENSSTTSVSKRFENGAAFTADLAVDLVNLLAPGSSSASGVSLDTSITIPLLRGSGKHIVREPLTQAERNVAYEIFEFEEFKREFAVDVATEYYNVLRKLDQIENSRKNYISQIRTRNRARSMADNEKLSEIEVDQAAQNELRARERWISAKQSYESSLDSFKILLGLPTDARIELDKGELEMLEGISDKLTDYNDQTSTSANLADSSDDTNEPAKAEQLYKELPATSSQKTLELLKSISNRLNGKSNTTIRKAPTKTATTVNKTFSSNDPNNLAEPGYKNKGPLEMPSQKAIKLAFDNRLDLRVAQGLVYDAQRDVVVAADNLRGELTLFGTAGTGGRRSIGGNNDNIKLRGDKIYSAALLTMDLPIERTEERDNYRNSLINMEQVLRNKNLLEDQIKLQIRNDLRTLLEARESIQIQAKSVEVADKRVKSTDEFFKLGRAQIRDVLEAQDSLLQAKNSFTSAVISYRLAELTLQRDMGLLKVGANGTWQEYQK